MPVVPNPHSARLQVQVGGLDFAALSLVAEESLSQPFCCRLEVLVPEGFSPGPVLGLPARIEVRGPDATFSVLNGAIHIQAAREISIQGQGGGAISFAQNGGGVIVTADGRVRIYGKSVTLGGQGGVSLNGPTSYQIGGAAPMPAVGVAQALQAQAIADLSAEEKTPEIKDVQINLHDFYDNKLPGHFEQLKGLKWHLISDCGEERSGVIEGYTIEVKGLRVRESIEFEIEDIDLVTAHRYKS